MSGREEIFGKVRSNLGVRPSGNDYDTRRARVMQRLGERPRHLIPARVAGKSSAELIETLRRWLEAASGQMIEVADEAEVPSAIARYLQQHNLPARLRLGDDTVLRGLPWSSTPALELLDGKAAASDTASLTHALAAVAETGTLVIPSGAANPVTLSFLPENNIVLVRREDIVGPLEDAWTRVRAVAASGARPGVSGLPRTVNMISGPSRSADIGGIPVLGAHGPKRFCLIVVG